MSDPKEYIDRGLYCETICRCNGTACDKSKCPIWNAPAADVAPVVHGEWLPVSDDDQYEGEYYCSVCNAEEFFFGNALFAPFCWHCGAKMDGGKGELHKNALDLINDLKTELLAVKEAWRKSGMDYIDLNAEWEGKYKTAKAEAIKEFAERLKYHAYDIVLYGEIVTVSRIERTMHEMMTEGKDGNV